MKQQPLLTLSAVLFAGGVLLHAVPPAAGAADALVTQSQALGGYLDSIRTQAAAAADAVLARQAAPQLEAAEQAYQTPALQAALAERVLASMGGGAVVEESLDKDVTLSCQTGAELSITAGSAVVTGGAWINLSQGQAVPQGAALTRGQVYLAAEDGAAIRMTAAGTVRLSGNSQKGQAAEDEMYTAYAGALHALGLFQGTDRGYELTRPATRAEGLVMLIRLLGREEQALAYSGSHPFTDVPAWAQPYVAYAYAEGYTSGIRADTFGTMMELRYRDYMTFLLRALGYDDSKREFDWATADQTAVRVGIQTEAERAEILASGRFMRGHVAYTSYRALFAAGKDGKQLAERLIAEGVFSRSALQAVQGL